MILGAFAMFLIMRKAMMQQLDDILEEQELRRLRRKMRKAKLKKNNRIKSNNSMWRFSVASYVFLAQTILK